MRASHDSDNENN